MSSPIHRPPGQRVGDRRRSTMLCVYSPPIPSPPLHLTIVLHSQQHIYTTLLHCSLSPLTSAALQQPTVIFSSPSHHQGATQFRSLTPPSLPTTIAAGISMRVRPRVSVQPVFARVRVFSDPSHSIPASMLSLPAMDGLGILLIL